MKPESAINDAQALVMYRAIITVTMIILVTFSLIFLSLLLQGNFASILSNPVRWFNDLDSSTTFDIVTVSAELLAAVLAIAITVVAIVVELAANRYSHRIAPLFVREPINIIVMSFLVIATIYCIWIALTLNTAAEAATAPNAGLLISMSMVTISLVILLPYFAFVMSFLSPVNIISKIKSSALDSVAGIETGHIIISKLKFLNAVDELQDIVRRSVELSDRAVETASINALLDLTIGYQQLINQIDTNVEEWFQIDDVIKNDLDFVSINATSLNHINSNKLWVEVKILRQYLDLVSDSNPSSRDTSYLIGINTRRIAVESLNWRPGLELVNLCMRCFNSYLRATINNKDTRTAYYIMNQYRMLAEELLSRGKNEVVQNIALQLQFYGLLGFKQDLPFLLEVAAEDVAQLATECISNNPELLDKLLDLLLELDQEIREEFQEDSLVGVRRAQLKLATKLLDCGEQQRAFRICKDIRDEKPERIEELIEQLQTENRKEYWEFTDRGVNFAYLEPELQPYLNILAEQIGKTGGGNSKSTS